MATIVRAARVLAAVAPLRPAFSYFPPPLALRLALRRALGPGFTAPVDQSCLPYMTRGGENVSKQHAPGVVVNGGKRKSLPFAPSRALLPGGERNG
jgi:hypothetical protein